jgi:hypothetical protein
MWITDERRVVGKQYETLVSKKTRPRRVGDDAVAADGSTTSNNDTERKSATACVYQISWRNVLSTMVIWDTAILSVTNHDIQLGPSSVGIDTPSFSKSLALLHCNVPCTVVEF